MGHVYHAPADKCIMVTISHLSAAPNPLLGHPDTVNMTKVNPGKWLTGNQSYPGNSISGHLSPDKQHLGRVSVHSQKSTSQTNIFFPFQNRSRGSAWIIIGCLRSERVGVYLMNLWNILMENKLLIEYESSLQFLSNINCYVVNNFWILGKHKICEEITCIIAGYPSQYFSIFNDKQITSTNTPLVNLRTSALLPTPSPPTTTTLHLPTPCSSQFSFLLITLSPHLTTLPSSPAAWLGLVQSPVVRPVQLYTVGDRRGFARIRALIYIVWQSAYSSYFNYFFLK